MPKVIGTKGNVVNFEVLGISPVIANLARKGILISKATEAGIIRAATFVAEEVKESIAGNRAETKSVDTGNFLNSVEVSNIGKGTATISSDVEYAKYLEFGTSRGIESRRHFSNTKERTKEKVKDEIGDKIKLVIKV